uniref:Melanotransferrin n=1 Tax=Varanus komodoensis TaxID=61221 RepID=A0A8D2JDZ3_VARKO
MEWPEKHVKCSAMAMAFQRKSLKPQIQCVSATSQEQCMQWIQVAVDAVTLAGEDVYLAGKTYGLALAAGERYADGDSTSTYYAVAVVRRAASDAFTIHELKGKKSCHTGYGRTAGWKIPVGLLLRMGLIQPQGCSILKAVSSFFSASCIPAASREDYPASLCELCVGDDRGNHKCDASSQERYYGYAGAFRCLAESQGDVAFVKHTSVFENTDGKLLAAASGGPHLPLPDSSLWRVRLPFQGTTLSRGPPSSSLRTSSSCAQMVPGLKWANSPSATGAGCLLGRSWSTRTAVLWLCTDFWTKLRYKWEKM